jgi:hypothetical protein
VLPVFLLINTSDSALPVESLTSVNSELVIYKPIVSFIEGIIKSAGPSGIESSLSGNLTAQA